MHDAPALLETQSRFLAALYDDGAGPLDAIAGNGLEPAARLQIYRHSCSETQVAALRTTYPGVLALVGEAFFDQTARGYRRAYPSPSGNLQGFGADFAEYLEQVPAACALAYLPDVARLEWRRQTSALAHDAESISSDALAHVLAGIGGGARVMLHPSVGMLASRHAVLTIWRYAMAPTAEPLQLPDQGERIALWREDDQVAITALDAASFACVEALAQAGTLDDAYHAAQAVDPAFDLAACIESLALHGWFTALAPHDQHEEDGACR